MAAINSDKNKALAALTSAALSLPGLAAAATLNANIRTNVSYGHYQESDNRMQVDVYHADASIPLSERLELAFSLDRDTYSGATPAFSMPSNMASQEKYTLADGLTKADIVSAASSISAATITFMGGLERFTQWQTVNNAAQATLSTQNEQILSSLSSSNSSTLEAITTEETKQLSALSAQYTIDQNTIASSYAQLRSPIAAQYLIDEKTLDLAFASQKSTLSSTYDSDVAALAPALPQLTARYNDAVDTAKTLSTQTAADYLRLYNDNISGLDSLKTTATNNYQTSNPRPTDSASLANGSITISFEGMAVGPSDYAGTPNLTPAASGRCSGTGSSGCYTEKKMVIGTVAPIGYDDPDNPVYTHFHNNYSPTNNSRYVGYHQDSTGIYIRAQDSQAFSLDSMSFSAAITPVAATANTSTNPIYGANPTLDNNGSLVVDHSNILGPQEYWEILGFNTALNPGLSSGDGTNYATRVAYQTIANGFDGTLTLNSTFRNVKAVWIHYHGYPNIPTNGINFQVGIDNLKISSASSAWDSAFTAFQSDYLNSTYYPALATLASNYNTQIDTLNNQLNTQLSTLKSDYDRQYAELAAANATAIASLSSAYEASLKTLTDNNQAQKDALTAQYNADLAAINAKEASATSSLTATYNTDKASITASYQSQIDTANASYQTGLTQQEQIATEGAKQAKIAAYRALLNSAIPTGTPSVQRFQYQPLETRSMPKFTTRYYWDSTTLSLTGGLSDEPDFLSNFSTVNVDHEFNNKMTAVSGSYGITSNTITRNSSGAHSSHHDNSDPNYGPTSYAPLDEQSLFHSFNTGFSQILSKNTVLQLSHNYTLQTGYLSNPYKYVYVRGEITPEEYYDMSNNTLNYDWSKATNLEVVGTELFRENRPRLRNTWSFSNHLSHHIPELDASAHFDYRFYIDDWGINSHTFEAKWHQSLPFGLTVTPSIRYYSQSQAKFFAPYFLAPRADGFYSSDFRLSAYGDLSGGVTVSKEFGRGIKLETGFEYVSHAGALKLGGGGIGSYANFDYYLAHANLSVDFSSKLFSGGGEHSGHNMHHHHGAPLPAGVMFGHMMNQADEIMVGYRYQYTDQSGSMRHGNDLASNQQLIDNACSGYSNGCLYTPKSMHMQMHMLDLMYAPTDWLNIMLMPQLMSMDMTMGQPLQSASSTHSGAKHTSNDIGDTIVTALVKVLDSDGHHLHAGLGTSAPTGNIAAKLSPGSLVSAAGTAITAGSATYQDYGMQLGSGTWDLKPSLTYSGQLDRWSWGAQFSGTKRLQKNKYGYAYGDIFQATSWGSYQLWDWLSASIRGVYTAQSKIRGASNQNHEYTSTVDYANNYGGRFADIGFGLNAYIPEGQFAGHNVSVEWLQPVSTDVNGYQLDRTGALSVNWNYSF